ncbi:SPOSA6832_04842, partial [Sporobolomyces salmonicolor]
MGGSQSTQKQPLEQLPPDDEPAPSAESTPAQQDADLDMTLHRAETAQHAQPTTGQPSAVTAASAQPPPPPVYHDLFKVPALPSSSATSSALHPSQSQPSAITSPTTTLRALPADIEHILSLGADQDDKPQKLASGSEERGELEKVVRELKAKAGMRAEGEVRMQEEGEGERRDELEKVESEMREKGVAREAGMVVEQEEGHAKLGAGEEVKVDVVMDQDSDAEVSSASDSDSSSSGLDSDSTSRAGPSTGKSKRTRQRPARAASPSSDLSDDESGPSSKTAPKTEHELEPEPSLPPLQKLDEDAEVARFGRVENVIESVVVVKADTSGDWRVLDEGTVVCWEDKTVIGTVRGLAFPFGSP